MASENENSDDEAPEAVTLSTGAAVAKQLVHAASSAVQQYVSLLSSFLQMHWLTAS
jgi:hypothetical protein